MGRFLLAAKAVLELEGKPLSYKQLTRSAIENNILNTIGKTPHNSMRARLSEELRLKGSTSIFQRTSKNRFALRKWKLPEYFADEFKKDVNEENVVCLNSNNPFFEGNTLNGIFSINNEFLSLLKDREKFLIRIRKEAELQLDLKQMISYVILRSESGKLLTYVRGKYSSAHKSLLKGKLSLGFGGHVLDVDINDLFGIIDAGVTNAAMREINEELKINTVAIFDIIKVIHDCTSSEGYKHLGIVLQGRLPKGIDLLTLKKELSINGVTLMSPKELWSNFHLFEYWSQLIIRELFLNFQPENISTIVPAIKPRNANKIVLVGEIATGKTSILNAISKKYNYKYISARQCLVEILQIPDFKNNDRSFFQEKAQSFITQKDGPYILAKTISEKVNDSSITLIDGIRNVATIIELKSFLGDCIVVYVDCPRDKALNNFVKRSTEKDSLKQFVKSREHPTELELPEIKKEADAILFNADNLEKTIKIFTNWLNSK